MPKRKKTDARPIELLNFELNKTLKKFKNIIVLYDFLNPEIIRDLCLKLGINDILKTSKFIYIHNLKHYRKQNKIDFILTFENINIQIKDINFLNFSLPISTIDRLKIIEFIYKINFSNKSVNVNRICK